MESMICKEKIRKLSQRSETGCYCILSIQVNWVNGRDQWWHTAMSAVSDVCDCEWMDVEDPLFMLYTRYQSLSQSSSQKKYFMYVTEGVEGREGLSHGDILHLRIPNRDFIQRLLTSTTLFTVCQVI